MKHIAFFFAAALTMLLMSGLVFAQDTSLTITSGGNVGIGTTSPSERAQLNDFTQTGPVYLKLATSGANAPPVGPKYSGIRLRHYDDNHGFTLESVDETGFAGAFHIKSHLNDSAGTTRLFIHRGSGNVGIGTTSPAQLLHLTSGSTGGTQVVIDNTDVGGRDFRLLSTGTGNAPGAGRLALFDNTGGGYRVVLDSSGNVGIGTTSPATELDIKNRIRLFVSGSGESELSFRSTNGDDAKIFGTTLGNGVGLRFWTDAGASAGERMRITEVGNVGIGTMSPDQLLSVNGNASKVGGGSWATFSDRRVKQDINTFTDGLSVVKGIRPVTFRYNGKLGYPTDKTYVGVIAQEIQSVAPYTIDTYRAKLNSDDAEETDVLRFDGTALTYIAINAIKELDAKVEEIRGQQKENQNLSSRLAELEVLVKSLAAERKSIDGKSLGELR